MRRTLMLLVLALTACGTVEVQAHPAPSALPTDIRPDEFAGAPRVLAGIDARAGHREWRKGDQVLFGLRLTKGADVQRWLLRLEVVEGRKPVRTARGTTGSSTQPAEFTIDPNRYGSWSFRLTFGDRPGERNVVSVVLRVAATVYDADGRQLARSSLHLPADLLGRGVVDAAEMARAADLAAAGSGARPEELDAAGVERWARTQVEAIVALLALLNVAQEDSVLAPYFWKVVQKPSVWSVLLSMGVRATLNVGLERSAGAERWPEHLPAQGRYVIVPVRVDANGTPALVADVLATEPLPPLHVCGGIVAAAARHPTDPALRFDLLLLAARSGGPPAGGVGPGH